MVFLRVRVCVRGLVVATAVVDGNRGAHRRIPRLTGMVNALLGGVVVVVAGAVAAMVLSPTAVPPWFSSSAAVPPPPP
ncbi:hypothetical protein SVIO_065240 [Streptomyces violaceusniger]|uniref:Uncharacterized protein n=1 Tax=Streptomyces violaceusniger TaxID=68280 RepID=A0A4D4L2S1_STRVO|nr:hypothetical protein SVIO_065240 [Streptomyces violaceusniger]